MEGNAAVSTRSALYYPYIHIGKQNENWLKATLLCFRHVCRIVPGNFTTRDYETIKPYTSLTAGPDKYPLLGSVNIYTRAVHDAQRALKSKIEANLGTIEKRFKKSETPAEYQSGPRSFQIHRNKLLEDYKDPGLAKLLEENQLAWPTDDVWDKDYDRKQWLTLHPQLGAAVMSTLALAVEKDKGLHIVTPSVRAHNALLANREEQVFDALLELPSVHAEGDVGKTVDEIAQIVITTGFDLTRLTPQVIKALIDDGADLQQFRLALADFAREIPPGMGPRARRKRLKQQADVVLAKWDEHQRLLPRSLRQSFKEVSVEKIAEKVGEKIGEGLSVAGGIAVTHSLLGFLPGLAISIVLVSGAKAYLKRKDHPMRYLNKIRKATNRSFGSLYVPQWTALAGSE